MRRGHDRVIRTASRACVPDRSGSRIDRPRLSLISQTRFHTSAEINETAVSLELIVGAEADDKACQSRAEAAETRVTSVKPNCSQPKPAAGPHTRQSSHHIACPTDRFPDSFWHPAVMAICQAHAMASRCPQYPAAWPSRFRMCPPARCASCGSWPQAADEDELHYWSLLFDDAFCTVLTGIRPPVSPHTAPYLDMSPSALASQRCQQP